MADTSVTIEGNLTRDPEIRYFNPGGNAVCKLGIAVNESWVDKASGERNESVSFFDAEVWGKQAENVHTSLSKGDRVIGSGSLRQQRWEQDGQTRTKVVLRLTSVGLSLRFNAATPSRSQRTAPEQGEPTPEPVGAPAEQGYDEEPF